jgi:NADP-dependent 3-hydroxy acid dehydrogenase YdfG
MIAQGLAANGAKVYIAGRRKEVVDQHVGSYGKGEILRLANLEPALHY